ncbi:MAG: hypothetical protein HON47_02690 [Candidatus Diapherotrites archaeon]|jgi:hypothetical protein|uniref:Uncharacterized protein n=1 Tax=Candidatus Iainarchaeum sp. TaxID=3101447 RepID=A0A8T5GEQ4_9ARCH|nr:hypothetical protein [Candidatus Diapherotrites archaeon]MBT7241555.1 hypothetical protein [Candidatus Diapherotrites archaeon]
MKKTIWILTILTIFILSFGCLEAPTDTSKEANQARAEILTKINQLENNPTLIELKKCNSEFKNMAENSSTEETLIEKYNKCKPLSDQALTEGKIVAQEIESYYGTVSQTFDYEVQTYLQQAVIIYYDSTLEPESIAFDVIPCTVAPVSAACKAKAFERLE